MESIPQLARLVPRAFTLDGDAYRYIKDNPKAAAAGGRLLFILGVALGLADVTRAILAWTTLPELAEVQRLLGRDLASLPFLARLGPTWAATLVGPGSWLWPVARWLWPTPLLSLLRLVTAPLGLLLGWLGYGLLAHWTARLLGGRGSLEGTLGCTALAEAPRLFLLCPFLPPLGLAQIGIWAWVLAGRFLAIKAAHGLHGWRAFWTALVPALVLVAASVWLVATSVGLAWWLGRLAR